MRAALQEFRAHATTRWGMHQAARTEPAFIGGSPSSADNKVTRFKSELVLQMYFKSGGFWKAVSEVRVAGT